MAKTVKRGGASVNIWKYKKPESKKCQKGSNEGNARASEHGQDIGQTGQMAVSRKGANDGKRCMGQSKSA